jgi:hypothetical protein
MESKILPKIVENDDSNISYNYFSVHIKSVAYDEKNIFSDSA